MIQTNRRRLLKLLAGAPLLAGLPLLANPNRTDILVASAAEEVDGKHWLVVMNDKGEQRLRYPLPARAHHVAAHPTRPWVAAVARRPGYYIEIVDYVTGEQVCRILPGEGRHFYGHAVFTPDGSGLYATEMDLATGEGRITLRRLNEQSNTPVRDLPSGGIGPHELVMAPDGKTLIVANGGILTAGREKLNLETMKPSLAYLDLESGKLVEQRFLSPSNHQLSIRHLDVNAQGDVIIAFQYQGGPNDDKALVAVHRRGTPLKLLRAPAEVNRQMAQYGGSARFDRSGRIAAVSAPKGNMITFWDMKHDRFITQLPATAGCGVAATTEAGCFIATTGHGKCYLYYPLDDYYEPVFLPFTLARLGWDNHMILFGAVT